MGCMGCMRSLATSSEPQLRLLALQIYLQSPSLLLIHINIHIIHYYSGREYYGARYGDTSGVLRLEWERRVFVGSWRWKGACICVPGRDLGYFLCFRVHKILFDGEVRIRVECWMIWHGAASAGRPHMSNQPKIIMFARPLEPHIDYRVFTLGIDIDK